MQARLLAAPSRPSHNQSKPESLLGPEQTHPSPWGIRDLPPKFRRSAPTRQVELRIRDVGIRLYCTQSEQPPCGAQSFPLAAPSDVMSFDIQLPPLSCLARRQKLKEILPLLEEIVLTVYAGGPEANPAAHRPAVTFSQPGQEDDRTGTTPHRIALSEREKKILEYVSRGCVNKEIASALSIALETVRTHLKNIYVKLNVHSRTEAAMKYFA